VLGYFVIMLLLEFSGHFNVTAAKMLIIRIVFVQEEEEEV
jgi:hypothetical protein